MDEVAVIQAILAGDTSRYAEIVREYQSIVANLCYRMGGAETDIEELTQQVFVELYQALPRFKFQSKLSTFIYRLTVNVVCKDIKHRSRVSFSSGTESVLESASDELNAEQQIIRQERIRQLRHAIGRLQQEQRTALILYTFNDFSYNDIAEVMQCTVAKVESLIFRARRNLAKMLKS